MSDIDTVVVNSLKALDPEWPIREADFDLRSCDVAEVPISDIASLSFGHLAGAGERPPFAGRDLWNVHRWAVLLRFDVGRPNDPRPLFGVAGQKRSKLSGGTRR